MGGPGPRVQSRCRDSGAPPPLAVFRDAADTTCIGRGRPRCVAHGEGEKAPGAGADVARCRAISRTSMLYMPISCDEIPDEDCTLVESATPGDHLRSTAARALSCHQPHGPTGTRVSPIEGRSTHGARHRPARPLDRCRRSGPRPAGPPDPKPTKPEQALQPEIANWAFLALPCCIRTSCAMKSPDLPVTPSRTRQADAPPAMSPRGQTAGPGPAAGVVTPPR